MVSSLALLMLQAATLDPSTDPALAKPITLHLATKSVKDVVKAMAKASGQDLEIATPIADLKATVLVKGLPTGRTMEALADTLGLAWRKEGDGYRLFRAAETTKAEEAYVAEERGTRMVISDRALPAARAAAISDDGAVQMEVAGRPGRGGRGGGRRMAVSYVRFDPSLLAIESAKSEPPTRLDPGAAIGASAFAKANLAWPGVQKGLDPAWNLAMGTVAMPKSPWENGAYALSDLLSAWHDATGLPVVADAFRFPMKASAPAQGWALASLQSLAQGDGLALRVAGGVARLRHPAYWRLRQQEASESQWRALEGSGRPTIADYAAFASGLTAPQAAAFRSLEAPLSLVSTESVRQAYPALRLWASLPNAAQSALLAGRAVPLSAAGGTDAYLFALREAPYYHAGDPTAVLAQPPARLGLFATGGGKAFTLRLGPERAGGVEYVVDLP